MENLFSAVSILAILNKWKKQLFVVFIAAGLVTFVFTLFIKNKYKSFTIVYPANLTTYTTETPTEQLLQLLESSDIRDSIIRKFNLIAHFEVDTNQKAWQSKMIAMYDESVSFEKTQYESVSLVVTDTDPLLAYAMVKEILHQLDLKARSLQRSKSKEILIVAKRLMDQKKHELDSLEVAMKEIRTKYGVYDFGAQAKESAKRYMKLVGTPGGNAFKEVDGIVKNLEEKGGEYISLTEHLWRTRGKYNDLKLDYEGVLRDVNKELTYTNVITPPRVADKKSGPMRTLVSLVAALSALILAMIVIGFIEQREKWQAALNTK